MAISLSLIFFSALVPKDLYLDSLSMTWRFENKHGDKSQASESMGQGLGTPQIIKTILDVLLIFLT